MLKATKTCSITQNCRRLTPGARVLLDDGLVGMKVDAIQGDDYLHRAERRPGFQP
ncbi:MAG: hypothetical protein ACLR7U_11410 [Ruthenibacterium lactatiformans]